MPSKLCVPTWGRLGEEFYNNGPKGRVVDKDWGGSRACIPLIWPQVVSPNELLLMRFSGLSNWDSLE